MLERYLIIPEWMLDLGLTLSERDAYALIWGFCQDGESDFHGSVSYLAHWCNVTERQAHTILKNLTDRGLIKKNATPGYPAHYSTTGCAITAQGGEVISPLKKLHGGYEEISYPTPEDISYDNKESNNKEIIKVDSVLRAREDDKVLYGERVLLTEAEHAKLVTRFGADDTARLVEILDLYLANKPKKYKSHYAAILAWCVRELAEQKTAEQRLKNSQEAAQRVNVRPAPATGFGAGLADANRRLKEIQDKYKN